MKNKKSTKTLIILSMLVAIDIVLSRVLAIPLPAIHSRLSFNFIAVFLSGSMFGPIAGGTTAMIADLIGVFMFPQGAFFYGYTISAFMRGLIYGLFFYKKDDHILLRSVASSLIIFIFINLLLNSFWFYMVTNNIQSIINIDMGKLITFMSGMIIAKLPANILLLFTQIFSIVVVNKYITPQIKRNF